MTWYSWALIALFTVRVVVSTATIGSKHLSPLNDKNDALSNFFLLVCVVVVVVSLNGRTH